MKKVIDFAFTHWKWVVGASSLLTIIFAFFILQIRIDNSLETLSIDDDPALLDLKQMEEEYGGNEFVVISFKGNDIFTPHVLTMIDTITRKIEDVKNVERVLSLTNAIAIKGETNELANFPLVPKNLLQSVSSEDLKKTVIMNRMHNRMLFSDDGNATAIIAWMDPMGKDDAARWEVVNAIEEIINKEKDERKFYIYGMPVYQKIIMDVMLRDQLILPVFLSLIVGLLLYFFFRDIKLVIVPFVLIGITGLWALGLMVMMGGTLNYVTFIIPIVVLIVSMCDSVHILAHHEEIKWRYVDRKDALKHVIVRIGIPIMLTSITTSVGFFSLGVSNIKPVRDFGIFTGLGVLFAFACSITLLPLVMSILKYKKGSYGKNTSYRIMETVLTGIGQIVLKNNRLIIAISSVIVTFSLIGMFRIEARQDVISMLKDRSQLEEAYKFIDFNMAGSCEFGILLDGEGENSITEPENLKVMERIQYRLLNERIQYRQLDEPLARKVISPVDYLKEMNQAINEGNSAYYITPATKEMASQLLLLYSFNEDQVKLESVLNFDYSKARLRMFTLSADDFVHAK